MQIDYSDISYDIYDRDAGECLICGFPTAQKAQEVCNDLNDEGCSDDCIVIASPMVKARLHIVGDSGLPEDVDATVHIPPHLLLLPATPGRDQKIIDHLNDHPAILNQIIGISFFSKTEPRSGA